MFSPCSLAWYQSVMWVMTIMVTSLERIYARTVLSSAPDPTAGHYISNSLLKTPGHSLHYRTSIGLGKQRLWGHKQNLVHTRTQEKGAVTPSVKTLPNVHLFHDFLVFHDTLSILLYLLYWIGLSILWTLTTFKYLYYVWCFNFRYIWFIYCVFLPSGSVMSDSFIDLMDSSPPNSLAHRSFQAKILDQFAISYSGGFSWSRESNFCLLHFLHG